MKRQQRPEKAEGWLTAASAPATPVLSAAPVDVGGWVTGNLAAIFGFYLYIKRSISREFCESRANKATRGAAEAGWAAVLTSKALLFLPWAGHPHWLGKMTDALLGRGRAALSTGKS